MVCVFAKHDMWYWCENFVVLWSLLKANSRTILMLYIINLRYWLFDEIERKIVINKNIWNITPPPQQYSIFVIPYQSLQLGQNPVGSIPGANLLPNNLTYPIIKNFNLEQLISIGISPKKERNEYTTWNKYTLNAVCLKCADSVLYANLDKSK